MERVAAREQLEIESPARDLRGPTAWLSRSLAVGLSVYALYWVVGIIQPQIYRVGFLLMTLVLSFVSFSFRGRGGSRVPWSDWVLIALASAALVWPIVDFDQFIYRAATPSTVDVVLGLVTIALVLEATRRTSGAILPVTALGFIAYAVYGPFLDRVGLGLIAHRGYDAARIVGSLYMTLEGIFGVPLDVAATYIVLFSLYGAVLNASGAGKFFLDWSMAAVGRSGSGAGPGRAITVAGLLLGTVSGSGVANTVTLGAVGWPLLRRSGYPSDMAGAMLSAAGIGAIICPPALGAAAFIIAEFLHISYLDVLTMAAIPAMLYFLGILLMIEADSRRKGVRPADVGDASVWSLTKRSGYHFLALVGIPILLVLGVTAFRAVFYSIVAAVALSFFDREHALWPRRLIAALENGGRSVLSVAATTATAGIIVGIVTLTGLGLKIAGVIVSLAGGYVFLTVVYSALAVWMLGLAVPVTASYIIAAVMVAPAMTRVGVPDVAAHMFIFYYAVLSEVSPPTALSPFAAAAITGGRPVPTMMLTWKYTLTAFAFPFAFTLSPQGLGLLLQAPWTDVLLVTLTSIVGVFSVAGGLGGWMLTEANRFERILATVGGLCLFAATALADALGLGLFGAALLLQWIRTRGAGGATQPAESPRFH
ncbi:MAG: TRAP transporter permease [Vicinamibacterales bacterium]